MAELFPAPLGPVRTVTVPGLASIERCWGAMPSREAMPRSSSRIDAGRKTAVTTDGGPARPTGPRSMRSNARPAAVLPSCAAWNSAPTRRSGQNTSGASNSAVSAVASATFPYTRRKPTSTATSATPSVARSSRTSAERKVMRSVAIAERRCAALSSSIRRADPSARPRARKVGSPAIRSSKRACRVLMACRAAVDRSALTSPMRTMNSGTKGNATRTMAADRTS